MKKLFAALLSVLGFNLVLAPHAHAICPICTVAVVAGVGVSRWLGIDDSVTGLWVGALIVSVILWTIDWLEKKHVRFTARGAVVAIAYYAITIVPLYFTGFFANSLSSIAFGLDKLMLGVVVGSIAFWAGAEWYSFLKEQNGGHAHFPFEKVVLPVAPVLIMSIIFYFLTA